MKFTHSARIILLALVVALSACGFKLAGRASLPESMRSIVLVSSEMTSTQRTMLSERLQQVGGRIVSAANAGTTNASVTRLQVSFRQLPDLRLFSSAESGRNVERITRLLDFNLKAAGGNQLIAPTTLTQQRDITLDDDNLHASNQERQAAIEDLEVALVNQLIQQLRRL